MGPVLEAAFHRLPGYPQLEARGACPNPIGRVGSEHVVDKSLAARTR
jgi:hypothetical protein